MIAAVVVTHSAPPDVLAACLGALADTTGIDEVVVVHNGEVSETPVVDREDVRVVRTDNRGYGAAVNHGIGLVPRAEAVAVLNDDAVPLAGWLPPLLDALGPDDVGAAQPMLVGADHAVVASLGVELDRYGAGVDVGDGSPVPARRGESELAIFTGGAVLLDAAFLAATGGFDERWFLYYEDVDLALRGRELGWRYRLVTTSVVEHRRSTTSSQHADRVRYLQERNRLWAAFRWAPPATVGRAVGLSVRRLRHRPVGVHGRALLAGLAGAPRELIRRRAPRRGWRPARSGRTGP